MQIIACITTNILKVNVLIFFVIFDAYALTLCMCEISETKYKKCYFEVILLLVIFFQSVPRCCICLTAFKHFYSLL